VRWTERDRSPASRGQRASRLGFIRAPAPISDFPNFFLTPHPNHFHIHSRPPHLKGRIAIVTDAGLDAMDVGGASDEGARSRMAKACGPDTSVLVSSSREVIPAGDGGKEADHRGEPVISRKPLRAGMPG
jgi:hypothetical protein